MKTPQQIQQDINKGTEESFKKFGTVEAKSIAELLKLYEKAADDLAALIAKNANRQGNIDIAVMQILIAQIEQRMDELNTLSNTAIADSVRKASPLGAAGLSSVLAQGAMVQAATGASEFVLNLFEADGLGLSDRLWQNNNGAKKVVGRAIQSAIVQGEGVYEAAWQLVAGTAKDALLKDTNNPWFKAARVMQTEMARAHDAAPKARPMNYQWVSNIQDICADNEVPFFFKQWGEWLPKCQLEFLPNDVQQAIKKKQADDAYAYDKYWFASPVESWRISKKLAGHNLSGFDYQDYPVAWEDE